MFHLLFWITLIILVVLPQVNFYDPFHCLQVVLNLFSILRTYMLILIKRWYFTVYGLLFFNNCTYYIIINKIWLLLFMCFEMIWILHCSLRVCGLSGWPGLQCWDRLLNDLELDASLSHVSGYVNVGSFWIWYSLGDFLLLSYEYCKVIV